MKEADTKTNTEASFNNMDTDTKAEVLQKAALGHRYLQDGNGPEDLQHKLQ